MDIAGLIAVVGAPLIRSVTGWLENAIRDGVIEKFEWKQLAETIMRVGVTTALIYFGIGSIEGVDINALAAAAGGMLFDIIARALKY